MKIVVPAVGRFLINDAVKLGARLTPGWSPQARVEAGGYVVRRSFKIGRWGDDECSARRHPGTMAVAPHDDAEGPVASLGAANRSRSGGIRGNELLTSATAAVLIALLLAEGITTLQIGALVDEHMFIGLVLIPPVLLKLASTGYRLGRYYTGSRAYTAKGPPRLPLRVLAPVLVIATIALFTSGVLLLVAGHKSRSLLQIHQVSSIVWVTVFAVHFLAYLPRVVRTLTNALGGTRENAVPGAGVRGLLVASATGGGVALASSLLPVIHSWHGG
jgi:hypothetical protein